MKIRVAKGRGIKGESGKMYEWPHEMEVTDLEGAALIENGCGEAVNVAPAPAPAPAPAAPAATRNTGR